MTITAELFSPSYEFYGRPASTTGGGAEGAQRPAPNTVNLAGVDYSIDLKQYRRQGLDSFRHLATNSNEPSDLLFDAAASWWRYRFDWRHGAGQVNVDLDADADPQRYRQSWRIDPWTQGCLELQHSTGLVLASAKANGRLVATDTHLYATTTGGISRTTDMVTWTPLTGLTGVVADMCTDGLDLYVATSTAIHHFTPASVASAGTLGTAQAYETVAFVGNRLLASYAQHLVEIKTATIVEILIHYQPSYRWTAIFAVGSKIYAGGFAGNRSSLISLVASATTGELIPGPEAVTFAFGEILRFGMSYAGAVLLATSLGTRFAQLAGDATLNYGALISEPGDCRCLTAEGRFAWFGWSVHADGRAGVGRMALDMFAAPLVPAYASDVSTPAVATTTAVVRFAGRTVFFLGGLGVYAESPTVFETHGYLDTGHIYFGTVENKILTALLLRFEPLVGGEVIETYITDSEGTVLVGATTTLVGQTELELNLNGSRVSTTELRITLTGDTTSTPCLVIWRARGYPVPPSNEQWLVPLILATKVVVGDGEGQELSYDPLFEINRLVELWRTKTPVFYYEGAAVYRVRIDNYQVVPWDWTDDSRSFNATVIVQLVSV